MVKIMILGGSGRSAKIYAALIAVVLVLMGLASTAASADPVTPNDTSKCARFAPAPDVYDNLCLQVHFYGNGWVSDVYESYNNNPPGAYPSIHVKDDSGSDYGAPRSGKSSGNYTWPGLIFVGSGGKIWACGYHFFHNTTLCTGKITVP